MGLRAGLSPKKPPSGGLRWQLAREGSRKHAQGRPGPGVAARRELDQRVPKWCHPSYLFAAANQGARSQKRGTFWACPLPDADSSSQRQKRTRRHAQPRGRRSCPTTTHPAQPRNCDRTPWQEQMGPWRFRAVCCKHLQDSRRASPSHCILLFFLPSCDAQLPSRRRTADKLPKLPKLRGVALGPPYGREHSAMPRDCGATDVCRAIACDDAVFKTSNSKAGSTENRRRQKMRPTMGVCAISRLGRRKIPCFVSGA